MPRSEPNAFPILLCAAICFAGAAGVAAGAHLQRLDEGQKASSSRMSAIAAFGAVAQTQQSYRFIDDEPKLDVAQASAVERPKISRIIIDTSGVSRLEGEGTPGSQILINTSGRMIAAAIVDRDGRWAVTLEKNLDAGDHTITSAATGPGGTRLGDEVRVFIPSDFAGRGVVAYDRARFPSGAPDAQPATYATDATTQRAQEIATAATERFSELMPPSRDSEPAAQTVAESENPAPPPAEPASEPSAVTDLLSSGAAAVREWMKASGEAYEREIAVPLSVPTGASSATAAQPASERAIKDWPVIKQARPAIDASGTAAEAARKIQLERDRADKRWRDAEERAAADPKSSAETAKQAEEAKRRQAEEAAAKARDAERRAADQARKAAEARKIVEGLKRLEAAQRAEDQRQAAAAPKADDGQKPAKRLEFTIEDDSSASSAEEREDHDTSTSRQRQAALDDPPRTNTERGSRVGGWRSDDDGDARRARSCSAGSIQRHRGKKYYIVQPGDTLWAIANRHYRHGSRYNIIYRANTRRIFDPDVIWPCQKLVLPLRGRRIG